MAMWRREELEPAAGPQPLRPGRSAASAVPSVEAAGREPVVRKADRNSAASAKTSERTVVAGIGRSIVIKGELSGNEDLAVEGRVEGAINLHQTLLTVGEHGKVKANVVAKAVVVVGLVQGNIQAAEKVDIREKGSVDGDIHAPRVAIAEGAHFRGSIDMRKAQSVKPAAPPATGGAAKVLEEPSAKAASKPKSVAAAAAPALKS